MKTRTQNVLNCIVRVALFICFCAIGAEIGFGLVIWQYGTFKSRAAAVATTFENADRETVLIHRMGKPHQRVRAFSESGKPLPIKVYKTPRNRN